VSWSIQAAVVGRERAGHADRVPRRLLGQPRWTSLATSTSTWS
jgi:hypothetical protein